MHEMQQEHVHETENWIRFLTIARAFFHEMDHLCKKLFLTLIHVQLSTGSLFSQIAQGALNIEWSEERVLLVKKLSISFFLFHVMKRHADEGNTTRTDLASSKYFWHNAYLVSVSFVTSRLHVPRIVASCDAFFMEIISILIESLSIIGSCSSLVKSDTNYKTQMRENYHVKNTLFLQSTVTKPFNRHLIMRYH